MQETTYELAQKKLKKKYNTIVKRALDKGYDIDITMYDLSVLLSMPCDYCGLNATGLDRKDNSRGYTLDNVTPACIRCNMIKGNIYDYTEMKEIGYEIAQSEAEEMYA